jgi:hypothetical protein
LTTSSSKPDRLKLEGAHVEWSGIYPLLVLTIAGRTARLTTEWKPALRAMGLVCIGEDFADLVPDRIYRDPDSGGETRLVGHTNDPRVYALMERFWEGKLIDGEEAFTSP